MAFEPEELRERIGALNDDQLLRMVYDEADQYRPEALEVAKEEIRRRGLEAEDEPAEEREPVEVQRRSAAGEAVDEAAEAALHSQQSLLCATCGSALRPALLVGETQIVAVFEDNHEQRFVHSFVCPKCGTADLFVDFETEVED